MTNYADNGCDGCSGTLIVAVVFVVVLVASKYFWAWVTLRSAVWP